MSKTIWGYDDGFEMDDLTDEERQAELEWEEMVVKNFISCKCGMIGLRVTKGEEGLKVGK